MREPQRRHDVLPRNKGAPQIQEGEGSAARAAVPDLPEETEVMVFYTAGSGPEHIGKPGG